MFKRVQNFETVTAEIKPSRGVGGETEAQSWSAASQRSLRHGLPLPGPLRKPRGLYGSFRLKWGQSAQAGVGPAVSARRSLPSPGMSRELVRFGDFQGIARGSLGAQKGQGPRAPGPAPVQLRPCAVQPGKAT